MKAVVYLEWKEKCFHVNEGDLKYLKSLLPRRAKLVRVRSDRALLRELPTATHVITWHFRPEWYSLAPKLVWVATPAAGKEFVAEDPRGTSSVHFGHFHGAIIAESVLAYLLAHCRGLIAKRGRWERNWLSDKCFTLAGTRAAILGYGHLGHAIADRLNAVGVATAGLSRHALEQRDWREGRLVVKKGKPQPPANFLSKYRPDWLICALPADSSTDNLVDAKLLARLPRHSVLVNVGRGNCVDEHALYSSLKSHRLAAAFLDVLKYEPSATVLTHPGSDERLFDCPNAFIMPHASAFSPDYLRRAFAELKSDGVL